MEAVSGSLRPESVIEAIAIGLQQMIPFTRLHVALGEPDAPQLDLWRAEIALSGAVTVRAVDPIPAEGTALRRPTTRRHRAFIRWTVTQPRAPTWVTWRHGTKRASAAA